MKTSKKWTSYLKYYMIAVMVILAAGIVGMVAMGFNTSVDFAGGTRIAVTVTDKNIEETKNAVISVLKDNKMSIQNQYIEEDGLEKTLVIVSGAKLADIDVDALNTSIETTADVDVVEIVEIGAVVKSDFFLKAGILLIVLMLVSILYYGMNKDWLCGLVSGFAGLITAIISMSIILLSRIRITYSGIIIVMLITFITVVCSGVINREIQAKHLEKDNKEMDYLEITNNVINSKILFVSIVYCAMFILFGFFGLILNTFMISQYVLQCLIALIVSYVVILLVGPSVYAEFTQITTDRAKQKLSKNVTSGTERKQTTKTVKRKSGAKKSKK